MSASADLAAFAEAQVGTPRVTRGLCVSGNTARRALNQDETILHYFDCIVTPPGSSTFSPADAPRSPLREIVANVDREITRVLKPAIEDDDKAR